MFVRCDVHATTHSLVLGLKLELLGYSRKEWLDLRKGASSDGYLSGHSLLIASM